MTDAGLVPRRGPPPESAVPTAEPPLTPAEEHVLLSKQVAARAEELLTDVAHGRWPAAELAALAAMPEPRCCAMRLTRRRCFFPQPTPGKSLGWPETMPGCVPPLCWPGQVAIAARDFVAQIERHLRTEENLLAARRRACRAPRRSVDTGTSGARSPRGLWSISRLPVQNTLEKRRQRSGPGSTVGRQTHLGGSREATGQCPVGLAVADNDEPHVVPGVVGASRRTLVIWTGCSRSTRGRCCSRPRHLRPRRSARRTRLP